MQINAKQDMFYSVTLTPNSQEYVELPIPAGAAGIQLRTSRNMSGFFTGGTEQTQGEQLQTGWASLFDTFRLEDNSRAQTKVIDLRYNAAPTADDMQHIEECALLASPIPGEQVYTVSNSHINLWTGPLGQARLFIRAREAAGFAAAIEDGDPGAPGSVTLHFVALMAPVIAAQTWKIFHIGEESDTNVEFTFPTGAISRNIITTTEPNVLEDIYIDGKHITSQPSTMVLDYNTLRDVEELSDFADRRYFWGANLAGQKVRFEKTVPGGLVFTSIYQG